LGLFDIYNKKGIKKKQRIIMDRKELSEDVQDINARLTHLEDATLDIRELMIKLIKQGNQIVTYLKAFEVEDITDEYVSKSPLSVGFNQKDDKFQAMKDLVDDYLSKQKDLAEFEKELKKNKDKLTPGIVGES
jgi:methyl coenzyme M reductase subunit D